MYILDGIEQTSKDTIKLINGIKELMDITKVKMQEQVPKIYSKDLLDVIFVYPYTKIEFLLDANIVGTRQSASTYLKELESIGILDSVKLGRSKYFINTKLYDMLKK